MYNKLVRALLNSLLLSHDWSQNDLALQTGLEETLVSRHLSGQRQIRDHHLSAYLRAFGSAERRDLLGAWLQEHLPREVITDVLQLPERRLYALPTSTEKC